MSNIKKFPGDTKQYLQTNRTNVYPLANLWSTLNVDLQSNLGALRISPRLEIVTSTTDNANLGCPVAFRWFNSKIWALCDTRIFNNTGSPGDAFTIDATTGAQTTYSADLSDMEVFNNTLCATPSAALYSTDGSTWTKRDTLTGSTNHVLTYFKKFDRLYYSDAITKVVSIDTNWVSSHAITYTTTGTLSMGATSATLSTAWTGVTGARETQFSTGSNRQVTYTAGSTSITWSGGLDSNASATITVLPGAPTNSNDYFINLGTAAYTIVTLRASSQYVWIGVLNLLSYGKQGKVVQWDGLSAAPLSEFPLDNAQGCLALAIDPERDTPYAMDSNGVLSAFNGSGFVEVGRLPFPQSKLPYNVAGQQNERFIHPNGMYFTKNGTLRCVINNRRDNSAELVIENMPSGIWEWSKETGFVHIQPFSYTPVGTSTITDYGQNRIARVGALASMNIPTNLNVNGTLLAGATYYTNASSTSSAIFTDNSKDDVQKKGYFVTTFFESDQVADKWNRFWASFRRFLDPADNIVFKYRHYEESPITATITWVDTTHFTTTTDITAYDPTASGFNGTTGGEVEILRGTGGGSCAHIISIVNNAGTYTVTLDETITGVTTGTATARFQKWLKLNPSSPLGQVISWADFGINATGNDAARIQIKGCFTYTGQGEFYKSAIISNPDIQFNQ